MPPQPPAQADLAQDDISQVPPDIAAEFVVSQHSDTAATDDEADVPSCDSQCVLTTPPRTPSPPATPGFILPTEDTFVSQMSKFRATHEGMYQGQSKHNQTLEDICKQLQQKNQTDQESIKANAANTQAIVGAIKDLTSCVKGLCDLVTQQNDVLQGIASGVARQEQGLHALASCALSAIPKEPSGTDTSSSRCSSATLHDPPVPLSDQPSTTQVVRPNPHVPADPVLRKSGRAKKDMAKK